MSLYFQETVLISLKLCDSECAPQQGVGVRRIREREREHRRDCRSSFPRKRKNDEGYYLRYPSLLARLIMKGGVYSAREEDFEYWMTGKIPKGVFCNFIPVRQVGRAQDLVPADRISRILCFFCLLFCYIMTFARDRQVTACCLTRVIARRRKSKYDGFVSRSRPAHRGA